MVYMEISVPSSRYCYETKTSKNEGIFKITLFCHFYILHLLFRQTQAEASFLLLTKILIHLQNFCWGKRCTLERTVLKRTWQQGNIPRSQGKEAQRSVWSACSQILGSDPLKPGAVGKGNGERWSKDTNFQLPKMNKFWRSATIQHTVFSNKTILYT